MLRQAHLQCFQDQKIKYFIRLRRGTYSVNYLRAAYKYFEDFSNFLNNKNPQLAIIIATSEEI